MVPVSPLLWKADAKPWILLGYGVWGGGCFFIQPSSTATDPIMETLTTALNVWAISVLLQASFNHLLLRPTSMSAIPLSVIKQATITLSSDHFCLPLSSTSSSLLSLHEFPFARNWWECIFWRIRNIFGSHNEKIYSMSLSFRVIHKLVLASSMFSLRKFILKDTQKLIKSKETLIKHFDLRKKLEPRQLTSRPHEL